MDTQSNSMSEERMQILRMLEEGKISAEQAASLLSAVGGSPAGPAPSGAGWAAQRLDDMPEYNASPADASAGDASAEEGSYGQEPLDDANGQGDPGHSPRWFKVRVTDTFTGRPKATITLPFGLVDWGLRVGAHFSPSMHQQEMNSLRSAFNHGMVGRIIDVVDEEDGEHVEIFVE